MTDFNDVGGTVRDEQIPQALTIDGSRVAQLLSLVDGGTVDGVDISVFYNNMLAHMSDSELHTGDGNPLPFAGLMDVSSGLATPNTSKRIVLRSETDALDIRAGVHEMIFSLDTDALASTRGIYGDSGGQVVPDSSGNIRIQSNHSALEFVKSGANTYTLDLNFDPSLLHHSALAGSNVRDAHHTAFVGLRADDNAQVASPDGSDQVRIYGADSRITTEVIGSAIRLLLNEGQISHDALSGASNAHAHHTAFTGLKVGTTTVAPNASHIITMAAGTNVTVTPSTNRITISVPGTNFNADLLDSQHGAWYLDRANHTGTQPHTTIYNWDESVQDVVAALIYAGANITKVYNDATNRLTLSVDTNNLNADLLDGQHGTWYLSRANHTGTQLSSTISDFANAAKDAFAASAREGANIGLSYNVATRQLTISVKQGSGSNLDADLWDGQEFADYLDQAVRTTDNPTFDRLTLSEAVLAPLVVSSAERVNNLNVDMVDGYHFDQDLRTSQSPTFVGMSLSGLSSQNRLVGVTGGNLGHQDLVTWIADTPNQVLVTDDGNGGVVLSTPQDLHSGATPTFNSMTLTNDLSVGVNLSVGQADSHLIPRLTDTYDIGSSTKLWRKGWFSELDTIVFAEQTVSLLGGWFIVGKRSGTFSTDVPDASAGAQTDIDFGTTMYTGEWVLVRSSLQAEYMQVGAHVSGTTYQTVRGVGGLGPHAWPLGQPFSVLGLEGDGRIELNAYDSPRIQLIQQGAGYNAQTELVRIGDLDGGWGYTTETWGLAFGEFDTNLPNFTMDPVNGIRLRHGGTVKLHLDSSGNALFTGTVTLTGGSGIANLSDAGDLATLNNIDLSYVTDAGDLAALSSLSLGSQYLTGFGSLAAKNTAALGIDTTGTLDNVPEGATYGKVKLTALDGSGLISMDAVVNGTFAKVKATALNASGLVVLDQVVDGTFAKVKSASLNASGLVLLDQTVDGTYGKVLSTKINAGSIILSGVEGDLDDLSDGATYKRTTANEKTGGSRAYTGLDSSGRVTKYVSPPENAPAGVTGLYLANNRLGYVSTGTWKTYMDNAGNFYLGGTGGVFRYTASSSDLLIGNSAGANLFWDQSTGKLSIRYGTTDKISLTSAGNATIVGSVSASGGEVVLDQNGIGLHSKGSYTGLGYYNSSGTLIVNTYHYQSGNDRYFDTTMQTNASGDNWMRLYTAGIGEYGAFIKMKSDQSTTDALGRLGVQVSAAAYNTLSWFYDRVAVDGDLEVNETLKVDTIQNYFSADLTLNPSGKTIVAGTGLRASSIDTASGNLTLSPAGDVVISTQFATVTGFRSRFRLENTSGTGHIHLQHGDANGENDFLIYNSVPLAVGFRFTSSGNIILGEGGGNVGIGTASPTAPLNVSGPGSSGNTIVSAVFTNQPTGTTGSTNTGASIHLSGTNTTARGVQIAGVNTGGSNNAHAMAFLTSAPASDPAERMRITEDGNVGIGTDSPGAKLEVNGTLRTSSIDTASGNLTLSPAGDVVVPDGSGSIQTQHSLATTFNHYELTNNVGAVFGVIGLMTSSADLFLGTDTYPQLVVLDRSSGNVGIGTSSPSRRLHVAADGANETIAVGRITGKASIQGDGLGFGTSMILDANGGLAALNYYDAGDVILAFGGGNVGIGTASPDAKLKVAGVAYINTNSDISPNSAGDGQLKIRGNGYTGFVALDATAMSIGHNSNSRHLDLMTDETTRVRIDYGTGNFLIGTTTDTGEKLQVNGDAYISGNLEVDGGITATGGVKTVRGSATTSGTVNTGFILPLGSAAMVVSWIQGQTNHRIEVVTRDSGGTTAWAGNHMGTGTNLQILMNDTTGEVLIDNTTSTSYTIHYIILLLN